MVGVIHRAERKTGVGPRFRKFIPSLPIPPLRQRDDARAWSWLALASCAAQTQRQPFQEVAQHLVATGAVMLVVGLTEQRRQLRLGHRKASVLEGLVHVHVLELERDAQLL